MVGVVGRDGIVLEGGSRRRDRLCCLSSLVLSLGHGVNNLVHLRSALRGLNMFLPGVLRRSTRVDVGEVTRNSVVILIVLVHIGADIDVVGSGEVTAPVVARWTSNSGTTPNASLGGRCVRTTAKDNASSSRTVVVVLQRGNLRLECCVRLIVRRVGRAVVRSVVRLRVVLVVRLRVRLKVTRGSMGPRHTTATKCNAASGRTVVVVLQRSDLML